MAHPLCPARRNWLMGRNMSQQNARPDIDELDTLLARQRDTLGPRHIDLATTHDKLAQLSQANGDYAMMLLNLTEALAIRRESGDRTAIAVTLVNLSNAAALLGRFVEARTSAEEAIALLRDIPGQELRLAHALDNLSPILAQINERTEARAAAEEALAIRRAKLGEHDPLVAGSLQMIASLILQDGDPEAARPLLRQALEIRRAVQGPEHFSVAAVLSLLGDVATQVGDDGEARACYEEALQIRRTAFGPVHPLIGFNLNNLARAHHHLGAYTDAKRCFGEALDVLTDVLGGEHLAVANTMSNTAELHRDFGQFAAAKQSLEQALAVQRRVLGERHPTVAGSLASLAAVTAQIGQYETAQSLYEEALSIATQEYGERSWMIAGTLDGLAVLADRTGDRSRARSLIDRSLQVRRETLGPRHPDTAISLRNRGLHFQHAGDLDAAVGDLQQAIAILTETVGPEHPDVAACEVDLAGAFLALGRLEDARGHAEQALTLAAGCENPTVRWQALAAESRVLAMLGFTGAAIFFGKAAVTVLQQLRAGLVALDPAAQRSFVGSKQKVYRHLAGLLIDEGRLAEAQRVLAMLKEDEFFDVLCRDAGVDPRLTFAQLTGLEARWQRHGDEAEGELALLAARVRKLRGKRDRSETENTELREARTRLDSAGRRFDTWLNALIDDFGRVDTNRAQEVASLNLQALRAIQADLEAFGTGVVLLHFLLGPDRLAIIVTAPGLQSDRDVFIGEAAISRLVHELRVAIELRTDDLLPVAQSLWRHLFAPIEDLLESLGARTLLLVLDGVLRYAPLAALHDGHRYLAERFALAILTPAVQSRMKDQPSVDWRLAGLGVSRTVPGYTRLAAVRDELAGIVRVGEAPEGIYPGTIYLDEAFTEDSLIDALDRHDVVHVASHFVFEAGNELASHLLLGDGSTITLERLRDRSFDFSGVELITLSACETAIGGGREGGREIEGFAALVQTRGARAVIATLWPVADASTSLLMREFYRRRRTGALCKAEALREAQLFLLHGADPSCTHPFHWAPFILMGNAL
jgi:CHAT domain-containing protein/tetratricopeptide (TPR) repeat protein